MSKNKNATEELIEQINVLRNLGLDPEKIVWDIVGRNPKFKIDQNVNVKSTKDQGTVRSYGIRGVPHKYLYEVVFDNNQVLNFLEDELE